MDEDNTSPSTDDVTSDDAQPESDQILSTLSDTDDESPVINSDDEDSVDETAVNEDTDDESTPEDVPTEEEESEESDLQPDESEEADPKEEARRRYEERQRAIAERKERIDQQTQEYVAEAGNDEYEQRLRNMEVQRYKELVDNNETKLINEFERAKSNPELQIFNPDNKEMFNPKAYDKALRDYNAGYVGYDTNGNMVEIKGSLYEHLTETAELLQGAVKSGAVQQVRATRKMKSSADTKPAAPQKETARDPILEVLQSD
jgi:hypothetical protein